MGEFFIMTEIFMAQGLCRNRHKKYLVLEFNQSVINFPGRDKLAVNSVVFDNMAYSLVYPLDLTTDLAKVHLRHQH
jgi:hypothetical protein